MLTNELLEEKYRVQRALAAQAADDLRSYERNVHAIVRDVECKFGLRFRYWKGDDAVASPQMPPHSGAMLPQP